MELKITKESVAYGRVAYDSFAEQAIESDILLPDYLPSVMRVMSCKAEPKIMTVVCDDRKLTVDGVVLVEIFYSSEEGRYPCPLSPPSAWLCAVVRHTRSVSNQIYRLSYKRSVHDTG